VPGETVTEVVGCTVTLGDAVGEGETVTFGVAEIIGVAETTGVVVAPGFVFVQPASRRTSIRATRIYTAFLFIIFLPIVRYVDIIAFRSLFIYPLL
jgi:hypothetical protein